MAELEDRLPTAPGGVAELLADADRPGGWLLLLDRIRQSYVDLEDPSYLDFEYVQAFADVLDALPPGPLAVTHVGGGGCTVARYVADTRPGSPQIVLEPDAALTALVRARLPFARGARVRIRPLDGRTGLAGLAAGSADVIVLDAFHGGRVPAELSTAEFVADVARVLRPGGVLLGNVADGPPGTFARRLVTTVRSTLPSMLLVADPAVLKRRRFGNLVFAASRGALPVAAVTRAASSAAFPRRVVTGRALIEFAGGAAALTDADPMRSPQPPDEIWRVGG
ncbi:MAG: fused MFS/spermidine synthase [Actinomycetota bacterium]|nr:fused MFS/spermidine synthase [Actinomycetota bacterium]